MTDATPPSGENHVDPLIDQAAAIMRSEDKPTILLLQRRLGVGYVRASRLFAAVQSSAPAGPTEGSGSG